MSSLSSDIIKDFTTQKLFYRKDDNTILSFKSIIQAKSFMKLNEIEKEYEIHESTAEPSRFILIHIESKLKILFTAENEVKHAV